MIVGPAAAGAGGLAIVVVADDLEGAAIGSFLILLMGAALAVQLRLVFRHDPPLVVDHFGIHVGNLSTMRIPWEQTVGAELWSYSGFTRAAAVQVTPEFMDRWTDCHTPRLRFLRRLTGGMASANMVPVPPTTKGRKGYIAEWLHHEITERQAQRPPDAGSPLSV